MIKGLQLKDGDLNFYHNHNTRRSMKRKFMSEVDCYEKLYPGHIENIDHYAERLKPDNSGFYAIKVTVKAGPGCNFELVKAHDEVMEDIEKLGRAAG